MGGAMLIMFAMLGVKGSLVGVSVRFLGLYKPYRGLSCGVSPWLFSDTVHLEVDSPNVVRHVGRLLDGHRGSTPFEACQ